MTDRYTELVKAAYEAQQAREGEGYVKLTSELTGIDTDLEALSAKREATCAALEAMDDAVEAAKEALDAYFAGRDEDDLIEATRGILADSEPLGAEFEQVWDDNREALFGIEPIPNEEDEYATAKLAGALS